MTYWIEVFKIWLRMTRKLLSGLIVFNTCPWVDGFWDLQIQKDMLRVYGGFIKRHWLEIWQ